MAYFRKIGDRWRAEIERNGRRISKRFPTRREAYLWAAQQESAITSGSPTYTHTVQDGIDRYIKDVTSAKATAKQERLRLYAFLRDFPALAGMRLADVRTSDLVDWRDRRLKKVSAASVLRELTPLRHMFKLAGREWGWMPKDSPMDAMGKPAAPPPRTRRVTPSEIRRIVRPMGYVTRQAPASITEEVAWAFLVALHTAMRSGEVLSMGRSTVDLARRVVTLGRHKTARRVGVRQVPITRAAARLLAVLDKSASLAGRDAYFTVSDASRDALFRRYVDGAGIVGLHFHDARAEALTRLAKRVDVLTLARITGHKDVRMLMIYSQTDMADVALQIG